MPLTEPNERLDTARLRSNRPFEQAHYLGFLL
jgi:hypothetical protein